MGSNNLKLTLAYKAFEIDANASGASHFQDKEQ